MNYLSRDKNCSNDNVLISSECTNCLIARRLDDYTYIKSYFDNIRTRGVVDIRDHLNRHHSDVLTLANNVRVLDVNDSALALYQADCKKELCEQLKIVFDKESYDLFREILIALFQGECKFECETVIQTLDGKNKNILFKLLIIKKYQNTLSEVIINAAEISHIKRQLEDLSESEEKFRTLFDTANDAILVFDKESGITLEANRKAQGLVGLPVEKMIGMHITQFCPKEEEGYCRELFNNLKEGDTFIDNFSMRHESGREVPVCISGSIMELKGKKLFAGIFREENMEKMKIKKRVLHEDNRLQNLTQREHEIYFMIANGFNNKQIANRLYISEKTVGTHRTNIMAKLEIHKESELVRHASKLGVI